MPVREHNCVRTLLLLAAEPAVYYFPLFRALREGAHKDVLARSPKPIHKNDCGESCL